MSYVLIVDDEELIRTYLRRRLESWGHGVKDAVSAEEALVVMEAEAASIAVIDVRLPGKDGLWLTDRMCERWPGTLIIIASGADDTESTEERGNVGVSFRLQKPFDGEKLREVIDQATQLLRKRESSGI